MHHLLAWQVFWQRTAYRSRWPRQASGREPLGLVVFQCSDCQLELLGRARQSLRRTAELGTAIAGELEAQFGDLGLSRDRILRHRGDRHRYDKLARNFLAGVMLAEVLLWWI